MNELRHFYGFKVLDLIHIYLKDIGYRKDINKECRIYINK